VPPSATTPTRLEAGLGPLPFDLSAAELRRRAEAELERARQALEAVLVSPGPASVRTVLEPLDTILAGALDVSLHGSLLFSVHPDPEVRTAAREVSEAADRFFHAFRLNDRLYARLRAIDLSGEDRASRFALAKLLREMRRSGVERDAETRRKLLELNQQIDVVGNRFNETIANRDRTLVLASADELEGLPPDYRATHPPDAEGRIRLTTKYPDFLPVMAYAERADVRRRLLYEFANRAYPENEPNLSELLALRWQFARLLGYPNYAAFVTEDKMLENPAAVRRLLDRLGRLLLGPARADLARYLARKRRDDPKATRVEPWEAQFFGAGYYDQKIRQEEFGVDLRELRSYLPYARVRDGLFALCRELFGIEIAPAAAPTWHSSVEPYDVRRGGEPLGRFYLDLEPRDGKFNHAACFTVRTGLAGLQLPQAALVCNFLEPGTSRESGRLEYPQVVTFFHEFGHLLHALLSGHGRWLYNRAAELEWDFIEAPSQLFEEWARDPDTLARFAVNPETGKAVPRELLERLKASEGLGRPLGWIRQVALASISLDLHEVDPTGRDLAEASRADYARYAPNRIPEEYHFHTAFGHLNGYSACYYTYAWSAVIARDLLTPFLSKGSLTDPELAARYAREILTPGSERPAAELVRAYLGRDFGYEAFEAWVTAPARLRSAPKARPSGRRRTRDRPRSASGRRRPGQAGLRTTPKRTARPRSGKT
jgi:thimet oligopeptidase